MAPPDDSIRRRAGLGTVRSVLAGTVVVALLGIVGALVSYRADVAEARHQVRTRLSRQGLATAEALEQHFALLAIELQHLAQHPLRDLNSPSAETLTVIRDDRGLFGGGVALLGLDATPLWSEPPNALRGIDIAQQPWFQRVLETESPSLEEFAPHTPSQVALAIPLREGAAMKAVMVGIIELHDEVLADFEGEQLAVLSGRGRVLLPRAPPTWARRGDLAQHLEAFRHSDEGLWSMEGEEFLAELVPVGATSLEVLALESEAESMAGIRRRLNVQLAFLTVLQVVTLGAFVVFLRGTYRTFLEVEARVAEHEKMVALGTAASLIAHEVKNSLNGLKAATSLLESGGDAALVSKTVRGQVERLAHVAQSLLSFSRPSQAQRAAVDVAHLVRETVEGLKALPEFDEAQVVLALESPLMVQTDPLLLTTAVDNVVRNAIEAAVAAKDVGRTTAPRVDVSAKQLGDAVVIGVEDNAGAAPDGFEARVGEPFFTTKPRGIGLGLAMTHRAVAQLGGALRFTRTTLGSRFELQLPLHEETTHARHAAGR
ncbi:MAG: HAMP domain-containing histidine kinase [Archangium sp.]|nr:HAMP domain-containing histidine kinase [Archangium sp.]